MAIVSPYQICLLWSHEIILVTAPQALHIYFRQPDHPPMGMQVQLCLSIQEQVIALVSAYVFNNGMALIDNFFDKTDFVDEQTLLPPHNLNLPDTKGCSQIRGIAEEKPDERGVIDYISYSLTTLLKN